jgi:hypothetical protein
MLVLGLIFLQERLRQDTHAQHLLLSDVPLSHLLHRVEQPLLVTCHVLLPLIQQQGLSRSQSQVILQLHQQVEQETCNAIGARAMDMCSVIVLACMF